MFSFPTAHVLGYPNTWLGGLYDGAARANAAGSQNSLKISFFLPLSNFYIPIAHAPDMMAEVHGPRDGL